MHKIIVLAKKKAGMSREEFIDKYENGHAVFGAKYFEGIIKDHKRYYPLPLSPASKDGENPGEVAPPYDVITIYSLRDENAFAEFATIWNDPEVQRAFVADELTLFDRDTILSGLCDTWEGEGIASATRKSEAG